MLSDIQEQLPMAKCQVCIHKKYTIELTDALADTDKMKIHQNFEGVRQQKQYQINMKWYGS